MTNIISPNIISIEWNDMDQNLLWIKDHDIKYNLISTKLINKNYPSLRLSDKKLLTDGMVCIINFIHLKFCLQNKSEIYWEQLIQNDLLDLRAMIQMLLPFIKETGQSVIHDLTNLEDLYLKQTENRQFVYTNSQYNRCIRVNNNSDLKNQVAPYFAKTGAGKNVDTKIIFRPYLSEYFTDHLGLLLMSIDMMANKLYVNWMDVLPMRMDNFKSSDLYLDTINKFSLYSDINPKGLYNNYENLFEEIKKMNISNESITDTNVYVNLNERILYNFPHTPATKIKLLNKYIDTTNGMSICDIYNAISNNLFHQIKNHKWLIYDLIHEGKPMSYIVYLEKIFNLENLWDGKMWTQLTDLQRDLFSVQWFQLLRSNNENENTILEKIHYFFTKYHKGVNRLIREGLLIPSPITEERGDDEGSSKEQTKNAQLGLNKVPIDELYAFFYYQIGALKESWYYYHLIVKRKQNKSEGYILHDEIHNIYVTPKNIYNFAKAFVSETFQYTGNTLKYVQFPKLWYSLNPSMINTIIHRLFDIPHTKLNYWMPFTQEQLRLAKRNGARQMEWFNINNYYRRFYPHIRKDNFIIMNRIMHDLIRSQLMDVIFESLIYQGILSTFSPSKEITNIKTIVENIGTTSEPEIAKYRMTKIKELNLYTNKDNQRDKIEKNAYYYVTHDTYGNLSPLREKEFPGFSKKYFDVLTSDIDWPLTYAMNWVSQINFYHHFAHNRVIYVTGATGVGKSTQVPKLLFYGLRMMNYNYSGKIMHTQPRIPPTFGTADYVSKEMGVPVRGYDEKHQKSLPTSNFYMQFKHSMEAHVDKNMDSYMKVATDGSLIVEIRKSPFLTNSKMMPTSDYNNNPVTWAKSYMTGNIYDIVMVDEAHEHNTRMDLILTLMKDTLYINNSLKLVITSATMDDDEPIYRRFYRSINDNRAYPLNCYIVENNFDRANMDRRVHISAPGTTTKFVVKNHYLSVEESDKITKDTYIPKAVEITLDIIKRSSVGNLLLFMPGQKEIEDSAQQLNDNTPSNVLCLGYIGTMSETDKDFIQKIDKNLKTYTRYKSDIYLSEKEITRRVAVGTYTRAVIVASPVAEASVTFPGLLYVIDTGFSKVNIFDPIEGISKLVLMPISNSSSTQRRGRVGRRAPGDFYALYHEKKLINNKTAYGIADQDFHDDMLDMLKEQIADVPIICKLNDINQIDTLILLEDCKKSQFHSFLQSKILCNPDVYKDIINAQYLLIPELEDIPSMYYTYFGKYKFAKDPIEYNLCKDINLFVNNKGSDDVEKYIKHKIKHSEIYSDIKWYCAFNHDDYDYQMEYYTFVSRGHTGYDGTQLIDEKLSFYIIHPDENVIMRDMYTGQLISLKKHDGVSDNYYNYLLKMNDIEFESDDPLKNNQVIMQILERCEHNEFDLFKTLLTIERGKMQLYIYKLSATDMGKIGLKPQRKNLDYDYFITYINQLIKEQDYNGIIIKSSFLSKITEFKTALNIDMLNNRYYLSWYIYGFNHSVHNDILALMCMLETVPDLAAWFKPSSEGTNRDKAIGIKNFVQRHSNTTSDIMFLWNLWTDFKQQFAKTGIFERKFIGNDIMADFMSNKSKFLNDEFVSLDQDKIFKSLYTSGKLNISDEILNYVEKMEINKDDQTNILDRNDTKAHIKNLSDMYSIDENMLLIFLNKYLGIIFNIERSLWIHNYQFQHHLLETETEHNIVDWVINLQLKSLDFVNKDPTPWNYIFESYMRAYSINLVKYENGLYHKIIRDDIIMDPWYWTPYILIEKTFIRDKSEYFIYHTEKTSKATNIIYLTPVKIEWLFRLNPVYFYYLFLDSDENKDDNIYVKQLENLFDETTLWDYLNSLNISELTKIMHRKIAYRRLNQ